MMRRLFSSARKPDLAIDFGTANTRVVTAHSGVVFDEPSLCCFSGELHNPVLEAAGEVVRRMRDRTSGSNRVVRPLNRGVLSDIGAAREFLAYAVRSSVGQRRLGSLRALIGIPADATNAERSALLSAAGDAGLRSVELVAEPLAAALGAGMDIDRPRGAMIVECGAGTTEAAVLSLGNICVTGSVRGGGDALDGAICDFLHFRHKFLIGPATAEATKCELVRMIQDGLGTEHDIRIKGRNLASGRPDAMHILALDLLPVIDKHVTGIASMVVSLLGQISPELSRDIHDQGIVLTGGGAEVALVGAAIANATGLTVQLAEDHRYCVALGLQRALLH